MTATDGKMRFGLPGQPLFPDLGDDTILKPTLNWLIQSEKSGKLDAEISYVTGGLTWERGLQSGLAGKRRHVDLVGWVTMDNQSGKTFENAKIKLMAGDVNKNPAASRHDLCDGFRSISGGAGVPPVSRKILRRISSLHPGTANDACAIARPSRLNLSAPAASSRKTIYVYDGAEIDNRYNGWGYENIRQDRDYGTQSNQKVWVMREFVNSEANHLGMALPKGKLRFYRRDADGQLEFVGEDTIDHTPRDETIRVNTGNAFDSSANASRRITTLTTSAELDESFEIKLRNHKKEAAEIRVVEHLYRWPTWEIADHSDAFVKTDANTIEFRVQLQPDEEKTLAYAVHYSW
jgi:hypothetical protein